MELAQIVQIALFFICIAFLVLLSIFLLIIASSFIIRKVNKAVKAKRAVKK